MASGKSDYQWKFEYSYVLIVFLIIGLLYSWTQVSKAERRAEQLEREIESVPTVEETAPVIQSQEKSLPASINHPEPVNGAVFQALNDEFVAPLTIENNESVAFYFVLSPLRSDSSSSDDFTTNFLKLLSNVTFYVRANSTANIKVPLGEYELYSASGSTWYGFDNFFGRDTIYQKYDGTYKFTESNGAYSGYTIVLDYIQNKVMDSDYISKEEFPN